MAQRFRLQPEPTFTAPVELPLHGGGMEAIPFTFKHRPRDEFNAWMQALPDMPDTEMLESILTGWGIEGEEFNRANVERLVRNYMGAPLAILNKYLSENGQSRLGNSAK